MSDDHAEQYNKKQVEESELASKIYDETIDMLQTEDRFVNFFKSYNKESVDGFIKYYASQKAFWHQHADSNYNYRLSNRNKYFKEALEMLREIFLKKLFNLKCRWVAGEMDLPGIEISTDFEKWAFDPAACSEMGPITQQEFDCYLDFSKTPLEQDDNNNDDDDDVESPHLALEFYHGHRSLFVEDPESTIPPWFRFYDARFGTAQLLNLPTTRMDLEQDYMHIWTKEIYAKSLSPEQLKGFVTISRKQRKELHENPGKEKAYIEEQNREYEERKKNMPAYIHLSTYNREIMDELTALIEPPEVLKLYKATREWRRRNKSFEEIEMDLIFLQEVKEYVPVASEDDFRIGIKNAYADYAHERRMDALVFIFEEYQMSLGSGIPFNWNPDVNNEALYTGNETGMRILAARKWKGEPENFDFLRKENLPLI